MSPHKRLITYSIIQKGHAHARPFSYLLSAAQKPVYLTLLNSFIAPHSLSVIYKGPILLLVKVAFWLLNKMSNLLLFLGGVPAGGGGKKAGATAPAGLWKLPQLLPVPHFLFLKSLHLCFFQETVLVGVYLVKMLLQAWLVCYFFLAQLAILVLSICLNISAPRFCCLPFLSCAMPAVLTSAPAIMQTIKNFVFIVRPSRLVVQ